MRQLVYPIFHKWTTTTDHFDDMLRPMSSPDLRSPRTELRRRGQRGSHDRAVIDPILDEGLLCHVGWADATPLKRDNDSARKYREKRAFFIGFGNYKTLRPPDRQSDGRPGPS